jgi:ribonuclease P protein component
MHFSISSKDAKAMVGCVPSMRGSQVSVKYLERDKFLYSVVVSRRFGNAVKRNRMKRILREHMRSSEASISPGMYLVFINRHYDETSREALISDLDRLIHRDRK